MFSDFTVVVEWLDCCLFGVSGGGGEVEGVSMLADYAELAGEKVFICRCRREHLLLDCVGDFEETIL